MIVHFKKIYNDNELKEESTIRKFRIVQKEGNSNINFNAMLPSEVDLLIK